VYMYTYLSGDFDGKPQHLRMARPSEAVGRRVLEAVSNLN
jgi:hypothetical protein